MTRLLLFITCFALLLPARADAKDGDHSLSVVLEPDVVEVGKRFRYKVEASTQSNASIQLSQPPVFPDGLVVQGQQSFPQFLSINGRVERRLTISFVVMPTRKGKFEISAPTMAFGKTTVVGEPRTVSVVSRGKAPTKKAESSEQYFIDTEVKPDTKVYVGQQLTLNYSVIVDARHMNVDFGPPDEPSLDEFWIEDMSERAAGRWRTSTVNGRMMRKRPLRTYALFPLKTGRVTIDPVGVSLQFGGFFRRGRQVQIASKPIDIEVLPLPPDAPEAFYEGNVGRWGFSTKLDTARTRVGRPVSLSLLVRGRGQINRVKVPNLPEIEGFRISEPLEDVKKEITSLEITGTKKLTYTLTPLREGEFEIPAIEFAWLDPTEGVYRTAKSKILKLSVGPGDLPPEPVEPARLTQRQGSSTEDLIDKLQNELGEPVADDPSSPAPFHRTPYYWLLLILGIVTTLALLLERPIRALLAKTQPRAEKARASKDALRQLEDATTPDDLSGAIKLYFRDVVGLNPGAVSPSRLARAMQPLGVEASELAGIVEALKFCDDARFAPKSGDFEHTLKNHARQCAESIRDIETRRPRISAGVSSTLLIFGLMFALWPVVDAHAETIEPATLYAQQDYLQAATIWADRARATGSPADQHNAGLAYARAKDFGRARLFLERAVVADPLNHTYETSRAQVEKIIRLQTIERSQMGKTLEGTEALFWWRTARSIPAWILPSLLLVLIWTLAAGLLVRRRGIQINGALVIGASLACLVVISWGLRAYALHEVRPVVLLNEKVELRDGPSEHASLQKRIPNARPGTVFAMLEQRGTWIKLHITDTRSAWVMNDTVEAIQD